MPNDEKFLQDFKRIFEESRDARGTMEAPPIITGEQVDPQGAHLQANLGIEALTTSNTRDFVILDYVSLLPRSTDGLP